MIPEASAILRDFFFGPGPIASVQQTMGPDWAPLFRVATTAGISWGVIVAVGLGLWLWGRGSAYSVLGIVVLEALLSTVMNQIFFLPRPDAESIVRYEHLEIGSFPSGHVFLATVVWGWLYASRCLPLWLTGIIIAIVGISRIYLGVHFVGDVLGGFLLGCGVVWVHGRGWPLAQGWLARRGRGFFVALGGMTVLAAVAAVTLIQPDNPYTWNAAGVMLAAPLALAAERLVGWDLSPDVRQPILSIGIGMAGVLPFLSLWLHLPEGALYASGATAGAATLWAWAAAPALLARVRSR